MTTDPGAIQKSADFVRAFMMGFEVEVQLLVETKLAVIMCTCTMFDCLCLNLTIQFDFANN